MRAIDAEFGAIAHIASLRSKMKQKVGSVLVCGKQILGLGYNKFTGYGSGVKNGNNWSIHAEMKVLRHVFNAPKAKGMTLYVVRKGYKMARPCPHCQQLLAKSSISRVVYSIDGCLEEMFL